MTRDERARYFAAHYEAQFGRKIDRLPDEEQPPMNRRERRRQQFGNGRAAQQVRR